MKHIIFSGKRLILMIAFACINFISMAQGGPLDPIDPSCDPLDPRCPIDDYYGVFIFAIILVAAYKAHKRRATSIQ